MPDCDGAELARRVTAAPACRVTQLIVAHASSQHASRRCSFELGFVGYLLKPVTVATLRDCLMLVLAASTEDWHLKTLPMARTIQHARAQRLSHPQSLRTIRQSKGGRAVTRALGLSRRFRAQWEGAVAAWKPADTYDSDDYQMPEMDAWKPRASPQREAQMIITSPHSHHALTGARHEGPDADCFAAGMDDYLTKPLDRAWLEARCHATYATSPSHALSRLPRRLAAQHNIPF